MNKQKISIGKLRDTPYRFVEEELSFTLGENTGDELLVNATICEDPVFGDYIQKIELPTKELSHG